MGAWNEFIMLRRKWSFSFVFMQKSIYLDQRSSWTNNSKWTFTKVGIDQNYSFIGLVVTVFTKGLRDRDSIQGWVIPKTQKMVFDTSLLNTQHYKVWIKGKVEQSRERSSALAFTSVWYLLKREPSVHPQLWLPTLLKTIFTIKITTWI